MRVVVAELASLPRLKPQHMSMPSADMSLVVFVSELQHGSVIKMGDEGVFESIQLAMVDLSDLDDVFGGASDAFAEAMAARDITRNFRNGYVNPPSKKQRTVAPAPAICLVAPLFVSPIMPPKHSTTPSSSFQAVTRASRSFALRYFKGSISAAAKPKTE